MTPYIIPVLVSAVARTAKRRVYNPWLAYMRLVVIVRVARDDLESM